jgi:glycosyltransferase involved in cell wall biosynthesis/ADP-heptose:LPS heptosyltransferase/predicted O-methyltransferase YrrM
MNDFMDVSRSRQTAAEGTSATPRFSFVMIVLNGMPFIEYSIKSIYDFAHEIIIIEGAVEKCMFAANPDGSSNDGTVEFIKSFPDPAGKIRLIQGAWPEKCEMQNEALKYVTGDYVWLIDSDEVYKARDLASIKEMLKADPEITQVNFIPENFWKGLDYIFTSTRFNEPAYHYRRLFKYRPGSSFSTHRPPTLYWPGENHSTEEMKLVDGHATRRMGIVMYHYSYVLNSQVRQKTELYKRYGWDAQWASNFKEWYEQCYSKWTPRNRVEIEKSYGVWTADPTSHTSRFFGRHPEVMEHFAATHQRQSDDTVTDEPTVHGLKIAGHYVHDGMKVETESDFSTSINELFAQIRPTKIIETGTYMGTGTTAAIGQALKDLKVDATFYTIEVNPTYHATALKNLKEKELDVRALNGLSVPHSMLPKEDDVRAATISTSEENIFVDHEEDRRVELYMAETDFDVQDDLLYLCMKSFDFQPDFVLLDSAGHMGNIEFNYLINHLRGPCHIALDDIHHVKHSKSLKQILSDPRFEMVVQSPEKFGFCIARFTPGDIPTTPTPKPAYEPATAHSVLVIRPDSIGDVILFSGVLEHIKAIYPAATLTVMVQKMAAELVKACPYVDKVIPFDRKAVEYDRNARNAMIHMLRARRFDVAIYPLYSRETFWDKFTLAVGSSTTIAIDGDDCNQPRHERLLNNLRYDMLLPAARQLKVETTRNDEFIANLGGRPFESSMPRVWTNKTHEQKVDSLLTALSVKDFIAVCPFAQAAMRQWPIHKWVELLENYKDQNILFCGPQSNYEDAQEIISLLRQPRVFNVCGKTSLLEMASLIGRSKLCISMESAPAHIAAAVDVPHVVIIGGGHFGRFMPYSDKTHLVAKEMSCFKCDWKCERWFWLADCISSIEVADVKKAVDVALGVALPCPAVSLEQRETEATIAIDDIAADTNEYLVSAIISTYNSGDSIAGCIEDLEQQTIADKMEIIVVNSNSPSNEEEIVLQLQKKYSNIKYLRTARRETLYKAWNRAIKIASGKYITNANCDDRHTPDALEKLSNALEANPDKAVAYADQQFVDALGGQPIRRFEAGRFNRFRLMSQWCFISSHPMWRRSIHKDIGYFDPQFFICGDYEFWLRVSQRYDFVYLPEILGDRVWNEDCLSTVEYHKKDGLCFLEDRIIRLAYHRAWKESFEIDQRGISANPLFRHQPDVQLWKRRIRAKVKGREFSCTSNIVAVNDSQPSAAPSLSIVIEASADDASTRRCLASLSKQTCNDFEVVLTESYGQYTEISKRYPFPVRHICLREDWGSPIARNTGIHLARGRFVAFIGTECIAHSCFVQNCIERLSQEGSIGLRARVMVPAERSEAWSPERFDLGEQPVVCMLHGEPCAFRKDILQKLDGFDTTLVGADFEELSYRIYKAFSEDISCIIYYPDIIAYHDYCGSREHHRNRDTSSQVGWKYAVGKDAAIYNYSEFFSSLLPSSRKGLERDFHKLMNIVLMLKTSHPAEAVEWAKKALALQPDDVGCRYSLAQLLVRSNSQEARHLLESLVAPLQQLVNAGHSRFLNYHPSELENTAACLLSVCTKLAHCYMSEKAFGKVKTVYQILVRNTAIVLSDAQRQTFMSILGKLQNVPEEPLTSADSEASIVAKTAQPAPASREEQTPRYLVSAIVSTYNSEDFVRGCLEDLERQTIANKLEIIVIDSGSEQNEDAIVREFQQKYGNIEYIKTTREGLYSAWNRAIKLAKGKYLTNANTDDRHRPDAFELMTRVLDSEPQVGLVWADQIVTDSANTAFEHCRRTSEWKWDDYSHNRLKLGCCVGSQPMWRASVHKEVGYFDEALTCAGDWDMWLRIADRHALKHIPEFLGAYYHNENGIEHGSPTHSLYERYVVGKRYGTPYIGVIPFVDGTQYPLVSILMAAHNDEKYIAEAIESILIQNYRRFELIVVNDGSTDSTAQIVAGYKDDRLRLVNKPNGGLSTARNTGLANSTGKFIVFVDADDVLSYDYVLEHMKAFQANPTAALVYCDHLLIDEKGRPLRELRQFEYTDQSALVRDMFRCGYPVIQPRGMLIRTAFDRIGLFDESFLTGEDYELMTRFIKAGLTAVRLPRAVYKRRMRTGSLSCDGDPNRTPWHFAAIDRLVSSFDHTTLFPDVDWSGIPSDKIAANAKYLIGATMLAMAKNYHAAGKPTSASEALSRATASLKQASVMGRSDGKLRQMFRECETLRRKVLFPTDDRAMEETTQENGSSDDNYNESVSTANLVSGTEKWQA